MFVLPKLQMNRSKKSLFVLSELFLKLNFTKNGPGEKVTSAANDSVYELKYVLA